MPGAGREECFGRQSERRARKGFSPRSFSQKKKEGGTGGTERHQEVRGESSRSGNRTFGNFTPSSLTGVRGRKNGVRSAPRQEEKEKGGRREGQN